MHFTFKAEQHIGNLKKNPLELQSCCSVGR